ncbi:MAG: phosphoribosyltransferase [Cyanobacteria bacterium P01_G01_bin.54]
MADLYVSWADYHRKVEQLAVLIHHSHWQFNQIVCIAKGGLRVGDLLCRLYDVPLAILSVASYGGSDNQTRGKIRFAEHLTMITPTLGDRVLLVDDLVDSGISLQESRQWLLRRYGEQIQALRTAVLWYKHCSFVEPDYYVDYLADDPWIHQPFEQYETLNPGQLAQRILGERDTARVMSPE